MQYRHLLSPIALGNITLKNHIPSPDASRQAGNRSAMGKVAQI